MPVAVRYDTIRDAILTCARKPTWIGLIYRTETTTKNCKTEKLKSKSRYVRSNSKRLGNEERLQCLQLIRPTAGWCFWCEGAAAVCRILQASLPRSRCHYRVVLRTCCWVQWLTYLLSKNKQPLLRSFCVVVLGPRSIETARAGSTGAHQTFCILFLANDRCLQAVLFL